MSRGILGRKVGMTQLYNEDGTVVPVTVIEAGPCNVLQVRTVERDGYEAVQLGFQNKPRRLAAQSERGHVAKKFESKRQKARGKVGVESVDKADCEPQRFVREIRGASELEVGGEVKVGDFAEVKSVDVTGTSKGRGYAGVMKRHNFAGQRASHGVKKVHRHAGGTGCSASPSRLFRGRRMSGQYGNKKNTKRNMKVVKVDAENNLIMVLGGVPGPSGGYVVIRETNMVR